ncbi:IQ-DOMAIN 5-RELATED, partial [Salix viminalis]
MGRATRWVKGLLGMKKDRDKERDHAAALISSDKKEKKRWSFTKSGKDDAPATLSGSMKDAAWLRSYLSETERQQSKHAIAVAAATAAAADAAVAAAAQAAVAVVRLTSHGRGTMFDGGKEKWAAVKIQT